MSIVLLAVTGGVLWLDIFSLPIAPVNTGLDPSWCGALIHFSTLKLQFGRDVIFTYGPLSHLISFVYTGELFTTRVVWELVSKTVFAAILCATIFSLPRVWRPVFIAYVLLFIWADPSCDALFFLVLTCAATALFRPRPLGSVAVFLIGSLLGVCSLIKFTYLLLALFAIGMAGGFYLCNRNPRRALELALGFALALLGSWILAGQSISGFPSYVVNSMEISFGYKQAMGIAAASDWIVIAGLAALLFGLIQCGVVFFDSRRLTTLCIVLFYAGTGLLSWTRAFVRADDHVLSFFSLFPMAMIALWIPVQPRPRPRRIGYVLSCLALASCLCGIFWQKPETVTRSIADATARIRRASSVVLNLGATTRQLESQLVHERSLNDLPRVRAEVGNQSVDVFGYEQGIALLNELNYTPRPVFQGYSAYTPRLIAANTAFYSSARAPAYTLVKYQAIDQRYPSSEDAGVLLQLLLNYRPLFEERGYSLWKRTSEPKPITPVLIATRSLLITEICEIPTEKNIWVEIDLPKSFRGWIRDLFYKPPSVDIRTHDPRGLQTTYRLVPSLSKTGFIINPHLKTSRDLLESALGTRPEPVVSFLVDVPRASRRFFQRRLSCRISSLPDWPTEMPDSRSRKALYRALFGEQGSQLELAQAFTSASETLIDRNSVNWHEFSDAHGATLLAAPDGVRISASGSDPFLLLPKLVLEPGKRGILRIDIEVPADTGLQLFYLPPAVPAFGDYHMDRSVRRGKNTVYFELSDAEVAGGRLRLDPGMLPGEYVISDFELRALPPEETAIP